MNFIMQHSEKSKLIDWLFVVCQFVLFFAVLAAGYFESFAFRRRSEFIMMMFSGFLFAAGTITLLIAAGVFGQRITPFPKPIKRARFVRRGIYAVIRHPMYFSLILMTVGYCIYFGAFYSLTGCAVLVLFFELKTRREEVYLKERFPEYMEYSKITKKFLPFIY